VRRFHNLFVPLVIAGLVLSACGGNSDSSGRTRNAAIDASQPPCLSDPALEYDETGSPLFVFTPCAGTSSVLSPLGAIDRVFVSAGERVKYPVILQVGGVTEFPLSSFSADGQQVGVDDVKITVTPCKDGGPCQVGDIGPAGGSVFATYGDNNRSYLETSPKGRINIVGSDLDALAKADMLAPDDSLGVGRSNTHKVLTLHMPELAKELEALNVDGLPMWYVPAKAEMQALVDFAETSATVPALQEQTADLITNAPYMTSTSDGSSSVWMRDPKVSEYFLYDVRQSGGNNGIVAQPIRSFALESEVKPVIEVTSTFVRGDLNTNGDNAASDGESGGDLTAQPDTGETTTTTTGDVGEQKTPVINEVTMIGEGMNRQVSVSWTPAAAESAAPQLVVLDPAQDNRAVYWREATAGSVVFMASVFPANQTFTAVIREADGTGGTVESNRKDFVPNPTSATENYQLMAPSELSITSSGTMVFFEWQFPMNHVAHTEQLAYLITSTDDAWPFTIYAGNSNSVSTTLKAFQPGVEYEFVVKQVFLGADQRPLDDSASLPSNAVRVVPRQALDDATRAREQSECDVDPVISVDKTEGVTTSDLVGVKVTHPCLSSTVADDVIATISIESQGNKKFAMSRCVGRQDRFRRCDAGTGSTLFDAKGFFEPGDLRISVNFSMVYLGLNFDEEDVFINRSVSVRFDVTGDPVCGIDDITVTATYASVSCPEGVKAAVTTASREMLVNQDEDELERSTVILTSGQRVPFEKRLESWTPVLLEVDRGFGGDGGIAFFCETDCGNSLSSWNLPISVDDQGFTLDRDRLKVPMCPNEDVMFEMNEIDFEAVAFKKVQNGLYAETFDNYRENGSVILGVSDSQLRGAWPSGDVIVVVEVSLPCGIGSNVFNFAVLNPPPAARVGTPTPTDVEAAPMADLGLLGDATVAGQFVAPSNANFIVLSDSDKAAARANEMSVRVDDGEWVSLGGVFTSGFAVPITGKKLHIRRTIEGKESVFTRDIVRSDEGDIGMAVLQPGGESPVVVSGSQAVLGVTSTEAGQSGSPIVPAIIVALLTILVLGGGAMVLRRRKVVG
jgi:hypothetical protein